MSKTNNSSNETRDYATRMSAFINSTHFNLDIDSVYTSFTETVNKLLNIQMDHKL